MLNFDQRTYVILIYQSNFIMKNINVTNILISASFFVGCNSTEPPPAKTGQQKKSPNVIIILTDDQGFGDIGYHGNPDIITPNLDKLAKQSVRFSHFYVNPVSAPTRASLMTGRYAIKTGIYDTYNGGTMMASDETTIAEMLKENGYTTGIFGKWHLGDNHPFRPQDQGFDEVLVHGGGGIGQPGDHPDNLYYNSIAGKEKRDSYFDPVLHHNGNAKKYEGYCSDIFTNEAIKFIKKNKKKPFFAYISYNAPHEPLLVPQDYLDMYKDTDIKPENYGERGKPFPEMTYKSHPYRRSDIEAAKRVYAMVTNIDDNVGKLYSFLKATNLLENTLLIFFTDNGPQHHRYRGGLKGKKGTILEGGIRVPCFMHYKNGFPQDRVIDNTSSVMDILPTVLDLCKIEPLANNNVDGISLLPLIEGTADNWKERTIYHQWSRGFPVKYHNIAIRKGDYKLLAYTGFDADIEDFQLYNINKDPKELNDLCDKMPELALKLKKEWDNWYNNVLKEHKVLRISIGSEHENPVLLTRNDWRGPLGTGWTNEEAFGYWDVKVVNEGTYDVELIFINNFSRNGTLTFRMSPYQWRYENADTTTNIIRLKNIHIPRGEYMLESWLYDGKKKISPFYIRITKK